MDEFSDYTLKKCTLCDIFRLYPDIGNVAVHYRARAEVCPYMRVDICTVISDFGNKTRS